jgi:hypothetical protein
MLSIVIVFSLVRNLEIVAASLQVLTPDAVLRKFIMVVAGQQGKGE